MADEKHLSNISSARDLDKERLDAASPSPNIRSPTTFSPINQDPNGRLFPWVEADNAKFSLKTLSRFPLMGALSLIGSALTVILSALVLHFFDGKPVITGHMPKPAAWLSIVLSLNAVCVQTAVTTGRSGKLSHHNLDQADVCVCSDMVGSSNKGANYRRGPALHLGNRSLPLGRNHRMEDLPLHPICDGSRCNTSCQWHHLAERHKQHK